MRCHARVYEYEDEDEDEDEDGGAGQSPMTESFGYCRFRLSIRPRKLPLQGSRWFAQAVEGRSCSVLPLVAAVLPAVRAGMRSRVQEWDTCVCAIICERVRAVDTQRARGACFLVPPSPTCERVMCEVGDRASAGAVTGSIGDGHGGYEIHI